MVEIARLGVVQLGENRVQTLETHRREFAVQATAAGVEASAVRWHMIGHLQRNKVRHVMGIVRMIHSIDSLRLAEEIQDEAEKTAKPMEALLEVNVAGEGTKFGCAVGAALHLAEQIDTMDQVRLVGLMCMAPYSQNPENARPHFTRLREIFEEIRFRKIGGDRFKHLSMGMSGDYQVAIEEGATIVRLGTALFG